MAHLIINSFQWCGQFLHLGLPTSSPFGRTVNPWAVTRHKSKAKAFQPCWEGPNPTLRDTGTEEEPFLHGSFWARHALCAKSLSLEFTKIFSLSSPFLYSFLPVCAPLLFVFTSHICPPNQEALNKAGSKQEPFFCEHLKSREDSLHPACPGQKDLPTSLAGYPHRAQQHPQLGSEMAFWPPGNAALLMWYSMFPT